MKRYDIWLLMSFIMISFPIYTDFASDLHGHLWASYSLFCHNLPAAKQWYENILKNNNSIHPRKGYIYVLYEAKKYQQVVELMQQIKTECEDDLEIQLVFARSLRQVGDKKQAEDLIIRLNNLFKKNVEVACEATQVYIERKELENALHAIDEILNNSPKKPNFFVFYFFKAQIYAQLNQYKNAYENIALCLESNPRCAQCWLLQGIMKEQEGNLQEAVKGYTVYLEISDQSNEIDEKVRKHLLDLLLKMNSSVNKQTYKFMGFFDYDMQYSNVLYMLLGRPYMHMVYRNNSMPLRINKWSILSL